tara:strand:- start:1999 stop:2385 length:387 start_codon:yes stop_codon:yes gene_type:complete
MDVVSFDFHHFSLCLTKKGLNNQLINPIQGSGSITIQNSINIALLDVFLCSPDKTPSYKMCFIYQLVFDESKKKWLMNILTELNPINYPLEWNQIEIMDSHKYVQNIKLSQLTPLLASELIKGNKTIE